MTTQTRVRPCCGNAAGGPTNPTEESAMLTADATTAVCDIATLWADATTKNPTELAGAVARLRGYAASLRDLIAADGPLSAHADSNLHLIDLFLTELETAIGDGTIRRDDDENQRRADYTAGHPAWQAEHDRRTVEGIRQEEFIRGWRAARREAVPTP